MGAVMAKSTPYPDNIRSMDVKPLASQHEITVAGWVLTDLAATGYITMKGVQKNNGSIHMNCGIKGNNLDDVSRQLEAKYRFKFVDIPICKL